MHIICPVCHTEYLLGDEFSQENFFKVRCFRCKHIWHPEEEVFVREEKELTAGYFEEQDKEEGELVEADTIFEESRGGEDNLSKDEAKEEKTDSEDEDILFPESVMNFSLDSTGMQAEEKSFSFKSSLKKIVIGIFILSIFSGLWFGRFWLVEKMPFLNSLYTFLGIEAEIPGFGLEFQEVKQQMIVEDGIDMLEVSGKVYNNTEKLLLVPLIKVSLQDVSGQEIQKQVSSISTNEILPHTSLPFIIRVFSPSSVASKLEIKFVKEE